MQGESETAAILAKVGDYYSGKLRQHGQSPRGVDWNGPESQRLRFGQLAELWRDVSDFTVCDYGCGYGALLEYLCGSATKFSGYLGLDISNDMVAAAQTKWQDEPRARFIVGNQPNQPVDFLVASGVLNVKLDVGEDRWESYVTELLESFAACTRRGFAFNALTSHADAERKRPDLWYADPGALLNRLIDPHRRRVRLLHDYPLFEFTVLVWHL